MAPVEQHPSSVTPTLTWQATAEQDPLFEESRPHGVLLEHAPPVVAGGGNAGSGGAIRSMFERVRKQSAMAKHFLDGGRPQEEVAQARAQEEIYPHGGRSRSATATSELGESGRVSYVGGEPSGWLGEQRSSARHSGVFSGPIEPLAEDVARLGSEVSQLRGEMREAARATREAMNEQLGQMRGEMRQLLEGLAAEKRLTSVTSTERVMLSA